MRAQCLPALLAIATIPLIGCERMGDKPPWWPADQKSSEPARKPEPVDQALFCQARPAASTSPAPKPASRDPATIQPRVREHYAQFRTCYQGALSRDPVATGRVEVRFTIRSDGSVERACLAKTTLQDGEAMQCLLEEFERVKFVPAQAPTRVVYPIMFLPDPPPSGSGNVPRRH